MEVGHYNAAPFGPKEANGFYVSYEGGQITNKITNQPCNVSIVFDFECNSSAVWLPNEGQPGNPSEFLRNITGITADGCLVSLCFFFFYQINQFGFCLFEKKILSITCNLIMPEHAIGINFKYINFF